jgi:hypothetical protein
MKTTLDRRARSLALALAFAAVPAIAGSPSTTGAVATKANRIVGTWHAFGDVSGANCATGIPGPALKPEVYLVYHAGGTLTEMPRFPSNAAQQARSMGVGSWYYQPETDTYFVSFRFDWFANGVLGGHAVVDRQITLDPGGDSLAGSVVAVRYDRNGNEVFSQCGSGTATRF